MRIINFDKAGRPTLGVRHDDAVIDLSIAAPELPGTLRALLAAGPEALERARTAAARADARAACDPAALRLLPLVHDPSKIVCLGLNYADHAKEGGHERPTYPSVFMRGPSSLTAHGAPLRVPRVCDKLDYEAELMIVIGRRGRHVPRERALELVAGYAPFNDGSVRPYQRLTSQWTMGKNFDETGPLGPDLVTADELPPGAAGLRIQSRVNGSVMQDASTADMLFDVAETIALLTECMTLEPGDLIASGTPAGVGYARKPPVWLTPGDVCEVEIEGVGVLSNPVAACARTRPPRACRSR